jgi:pyruvate dehydrogenase E2 component (dihydrolipoamide acetyltransferase)
MPTVIMPKMGDAMEEGTLLRWLKQVGEEVSAGDMIAEIETDKVTLEIEAADGGVLTKTLVGEGQTVPIGTAIATIGEDSQVTVEAQPAIETATVDGGVPAHTEVGAEGETTAVEPGSPLAARDEAITTAGVGAQAPVPNARDADADGAAIDAMRQAATSADPTGGNGAVAAPRPVEARGTGERLRASPLVKRLAAEHGIDLSQVEGTGPGGRIVRDDIEPFLTGAQVPPTAPAAAATAPAPTEVAAPVPAEPQAASAPPSRPVAAPAPAPVSGRPAGVVREMSRIRRTTGRRMTESKQTIPHFYVSIEVDMAAAIQLRSQVNAQITDDAAKVSYNDFIVKACALALREFPNLNSSIEGDQLYDHPNVDINIAVAIENGLIAPFIPDADQKSLGAIARMAKDLAGRARAGGLKPEEYQGGTFTISNLGMFDVEEFIAVINPPQAAILAVGSIREQPVVTDGEITVGQRMKITLAADHRVTDGAEVARFLASVKRYLQNPMLLAIS